MQFKQTFYQSREKRMCCAAAGLLALVAVIFDLVVWLASCLQVRRSGQWMDAAGRRDESSDRGQRQGERDYV